MTGRRVRIGVLGAGGVVRSFHLPVLRAMPNIEVRWICDQDQSRADTVASAFGIRRSHASLDQCADDVDIVLVAIPVAFRKGALQQVISNRWHAFCEKPFASSADEHRWMISEARASKVRLGVGFPRRFYRSTLIARKLIASGILGSIESVVAGEGYRVHRTGRDADWYQASRDASGGGVLMESGPHLIDQVLTICAVRRFSLVHCVQRSHEGLDFDTVALGTFVVEAGERAPFELYLSRLRDVYNGIVIRCQRGELQIGLEVDSSVHLSGINEARSVRLAALEGPVDLLAAFQAEWSTFISSCANDSEVRDYDTGLLTTDFIDAGYKLGRTAGKVDGLGLGADE